MPALATQIRRVCRTKPWGRFQVRGVRFLNETLKTSGALLGDSMGLGKTYQTCAYLKLHIEMRPVVISCPASVKFAWEQELWKHTRLDSEVLSGMAPCETTGDIIIINHDILTAWLPFLLKRKPKLFVIDEVQKCKNRKAKRTKSATTLAKASKRTIGLSGTPITKGPADFFPILNMIAPKVFPSWHSYAFKFCGPKKGFRGHWQFDGATNIGELVQLIKPLMLRRTKQEVLTELPPAVRTVIPVQIPMKEYKAARDSFIEWYARNKGVGAARRAANAEQIVRLNQLRQLAAEGLIDTAIEWMKDWREDNNGAKMVIFAHHRRIVAKLALALPNHALVTGAVTGEARQAAIDRFQTDPGCKWFIGNLEAAGTGTTLTAAPITATVELAWVPTTHDQADDRINRIGQKAKHIDNVYFIAKGTVMEHIWDVLETRRDIISQVVDGKAAEAVQNLVIEKLLQEKT